MADRPFSFEPVYAISEGIELGRDLVAGEIGWPQGEIAAGIAGCAFAKLGDSPGPFGIGADDEEVAELSDEALVNRLECETQGFGATADTAELSPIVANMLLELALRVFRRFLDR